MWKKYTDRVKPLITKRNIVIVIIVAIILVQFIQLRSISKNISSLQDRDSSLITEVGQVKGAYPNLGQDLNEIRSFLRLPLKTYAALETETVKESENKNDLQVALFEYIDYLSGQKQLTQRLAANKSYLEKLSTSFKEEGVSLVGIKEDTNGFSVAVNTAEGDQLALYSVSKTDGYLTLKTIKSTSKITADNYDDFQEQVLKFLTKEKDNIIATTTEVKNLRTAIETAINSEEIQAELTKLGEKISLTPTLSDTQIVYSVSNKSNEIIGDIILDTGTLRITLIDKKNATLSIQVTDLSTSLIPFLQKLDAKVLIEKKADIALGNIQKTLVDKGFLLLLKEAGFTISPTPREDKSRIYYDLFDKENKKISIIAIEKTTGVVDILDVNGNNAQNLLFFNPDFKKKSSSSSEVIQKYSAKISHAPNTLNILLAGKSGSMLDTLIFVHIKDDVRQVKMVSIPRDLFYNGRKINAFASYYGMAELKKVLSEITGYKIDKYAVIDMYAFADVVDLIGGIDVHLDRPLIDPSYKTVDNGVEGTLYYEAGDYHLSGTEALRIARSRKTSSDFARAERQQLILKAVQDKAKNLGFGDSDVIYEIAKTVLAKTETDVNLQEAIAYFFRYQNYSIKSPSVMSSGNVLYVPPYITAEDCQKQIDAAIATGDMKPACEGLEHAYTLLPRDNNWDAIKWFFKKELDGA